MPTTEERLDALEAWRAQLDTWRAQTDPRLDTLNEFRARVTDLLKELRQGKVRPLEGGKTRRWQEQLSPDELAAIAWLVMELRKPA